MSSDPLSKLVTLANGHQVALRQAAMCYGLLASYLEGHEAEWDPVPLLRDLALGRELSSGQVRTLAEERLIDERGELDPVMRSLILSSVRGQAGVLYLDSPFTEPLDRALAELICAKERVRSSFSADVAEGLVRSNIVADALGSLPPKKWTDRQPPSGGLPPL